MHTQKMVKTAILSFSVLLMGVISISGGLSTISEHFASVSQTSIQLLISVPCISIIAMSLLIGVLQDYISKKALTITGILLFIIGGTLPAIVHNFQWILVLRAILGIGIGMLQPLSGSLISEYYVGSERSKAMGQQTAAQMLGCAVMVFLGGALANIGWNMTFYVHLFAIVPLVIVCFALPNVPPKKQVNNSARLATSLTRQTAKWVLIVFAFFISGQVFSTFIPFFISSNQLGSSSASGLTVTLFSIGGFVMGLLYGKIVGKLKRYIVILGFLLLAAAYLIIIFSSHIFTICIASFLCGFPFSMIMPSVVAGASESVEANAAPMAIAVVLSSQNLAMFLSPIVITPFAGLLGCDINKAAFIVATTLLALAVVVMVIGNRVETLGIKHSGS